MSLDLWIEVRVRLRREPKLRRMCRTLEIPRTHGLGLIVDLWLYAAEQGSVDGDLSNTDHRDIALELDWPEARAEELWSALQAPGPSSPEHPDGEIGFVTPEGKIHKWEAFRLFFNLALLKKDKSLQKGRDRVRKHRETQRLLTLESNGSSNISVTHGNAHTGPDQTGHTSKHHSSPEGDASEEMNPKDLMELWNSKADKILSRVKGLSDKRTRHAKARITQNPNLEYWASVIDQINQSDFCRGLTDRGDWCANFDWFIKPDTGMMVLEGKYDNKGGARVKSAKGAGAAAPDDESTADRMEQA